MGAAEGVAGADHAVEGGEIEGGEGDLGRETRGGGADGARRAAGAQGGDGDGELDQAAAAEGVAEGALPGDERGAGELFRERGGLEPAGLEGAGAVALQPDASPGEQGAGQGVEAGGEAGAVGLVGGEVVHLVVQALGEQGVVAAVAGEHGEGGAVAEANGTGRAILVGRGRVGVEDF